jgi:predicted DNA-binding transcriptional regulator YafY
VIRSTRLLSILQALRGRRRPVPASVLADELGVSVRTIYRDVATLNAEGAAIRGDPGLGYLLGDGFLMPPLTLTDAEVDAVVLGLRLAAEQGDDDLTRSSRDALAKLAAVLPEERRRLVEESGLTVPPRTGEGLGAGAAWMPLARRALREERKLRLHYRDGEGRPSERVVWPVALAFFEKARLLAAWCEERRDFRAFRLDRIADAALLDERLPRRRATLMRAWRRAVGAPEPG